MSFLPPEQYPNWKLKLLQGQVDTEFAAQVASVLARLHCVSVNRPDLARKFDSRENFHLLRTEPYLLAAAAQHPELANQLQEVARRTADVGIAVVHGDVSPKNILFSADGPIFLDAECATYGDPAFDVAFCLTHLLLKCLVRPDCAHALLLSYNQFAESYFKIANFDVRQRIEARIAVLLPALMLARIDGKSPVEYLDSKTSQQNTVRRVASELLRTRVTDLGEIARKWSTEIRCA